MWLNLLSLNNSSNTCSTSTMVDADNQTKKKEETEESCMEKESIILSSSGKSMIAISSKHFAVVFGAAVHENLMAIIVLLYLYCWK